MQRGFFTSLCVVLVIIAAFRACGHTSQSTKAVTPPPTNYEQRFCDTGELHDYSNKNPEHITVTLGQGCFGDHTKLPLAWDQYFIQKSQQSGDWAAVWCEGHPLPGEPRPYYEDMGTTFANCREQHAKSDEFFLQGKGTITFRRTSVHPEFVAKAQEEETQASYKLTPTGPTSGDPHGYSFTIEQCYRSGEKIECWGKAVNKTDAPTTLGLNDSNAVDDEGNSISVGLFGGGFMFPNTNVPNGWGAHLLPDVPTKFTVTIPDPHQNVKAINLELRVQWGPGGVDTLIYKDIPVQ